MEDSILLRSRSIERPQIFPAEKEILRIAITVPSAFQEMVNEFGINKLSFFTETAQRIFYIVESVVKKGEQNICEAVTAQKSIHPDDFIIIQEIVKPRKQPSTNWIKIIGSPNADEDIHKIITHALLMIKIHKIDDEMKEIGLQLKTSSEELINPLLMRLQEIMKVRTSYYEQIQ